MNGIFSYIWLICMVNVEVNIPYKDDMGLASMISKSTQISESRHLIFCKFAVWTKNVTFPVHHSKKGQCSLNEWLLMITSCGGGLFVMKSNQIPEWCTGRPF